jgi:hypothetical protein
MMQLLSPYKVVFVRELVTRNFEVRDILRASVQVLMIYVAVEGLVKLLFRRSRLFWFLIISER